MSTLGSVAKLLCALVIALVVCGPVATLGRTASSLKEPPLKLRRLPGAKLHDIGEPLITTDGRTARTLSSTSLDAAATLQGGMATEQPQLLRGSLTESTATNSRRMLMAEIPKCPECQRTSGDEGQCRVRGTSTIRTCSLGSQATQGIVATEEPRPLQGSLIESSATDSRRVLMAEIPKCPECQRTSGDEGQCRVRGTSTIRTCSLGSQATQGIVATEEPWLLQGSLIESSATDSRRVLMAGIPKCPECQRTSGNRGQCRMRGSGAIRPCWLSSRATNWENLVSDAPARLNAEEDDVAGAPQV
eukprot:jgi/Ulvmu1/2262/UM013_0109.1